MQRREHAVGQALTRVNQELEQVRVRVRACVCVDGWVWCRWMPVDANSRIAATHRCRNAFFIPVQSAQSVSFSSLASVPAPFLFFRLIFVCFFLFSFHLIPQTMQWAHLERHWTASKSDEVIARHAAMVRDAWNTASSSSSSSPPSSSSSPSSAATAAATAAGTVGALASNDHPALPPALPVADVALLKETRVGRLHHKMAKVYESFASKNTRLAAMLQVCVCRCVGGWVSLVG
jgi:hypothetical protein